MMFIITGIAIPALMTSMITAIPNVHVLIKIGLGIASLFWAGDFTLRYFPRIFTVSILECLHPCSILVHRRIRDGDAGSSEKLFKNLEQFVPNLIEVLG